MIRYVVLLVALFFASEGLAQQKRACITVLVKTKYPNTLWLEEQVPTILPQPRLWQANVHKDTTIRIYLTDPPFKRLTLRDPDYLVPASFYIENGDSIVVGCNFNTAWSGVLFDRSPHNRGILNAHTTVLEAFKQRFESATPGFEWQTFARYVDKEYAFFSKQHQTVIDSFTSDGFRRFAIEDLTALPLQIKLDYLVRTIPLNEFPEELCNDSLPLSNLILSKELQSNHNFHSLLENWTTLIRDLPPSCMKQGETIDRALRSTNGETRDRILATHLSREFFYVSRPNDLPLIDSLTTRYPVVTPQIAEELDVIRGHQKRLAPGMIAPELELPDTAGVMRRLSDFRGKPVLINFWGTWCQGCHMQVSNMRQLITDYANTDLVILGVALEAKFVRGWRKFLMNEGLTGPQWYSEGQFHSQIMDSYNLFASGIPRYVLIDREGKIIDAYAPLPSNPKLRKLIDRVLNAY